jgi:dolichol-phosphate mannosyltransferase
MFFAGVQLISLGVLGEYLGRMYEEVKGRPLFLVAEELGVERAPSDTGGAAAPGPQPRVSERRQAE